MSAGKDYLSLPLRDFIADVGGKSPTPGGGSVAAVVGALAAALARMAVAYTAGKPAYREHEDRLQQLLDEFRQAAQTFGQWVREDMVAYEELVAARKSGDAVQHQQALRHAIAVPIEIITLAEQVAARADEMKAFTNPYLRSDLQAAALLASASARTAAAGARMNLADIDDPREAERLKHELDLRLERLARHSEAVLNDDRD